MTKINVNFDGGYGLVCVVLIIMKCLGYLNWSWIWVFAPLWLPIVIALGLIIIVFIGTGLIMGVIWLYFSTKDLIERILAPWN